MPSFGTWSAPGVWRQRLLTLGHQRGYNFHLVLAGQSLLEPSHHAVHKPVAHGQAVCRRSEDTQAKATSASFSPRCE